jgi:multidrug efflux pump subunit AcrA (membrane-fusion protein)
MVEVLSREPRVKSREPENTKPHIGPSEWQALEQRLVKPGNTSMIKRQITTAFLFAALVAASLPTWAANEDDAAGASPVASTAAAPFEVESVVLRLLEEAEVPAQEPGVITAVAVREGQRVKLGELLSQIDDQVPRLAADAAKAQYDIARAKATNDIRIRFAKKSLEVAEAELRRSTESIERLAKSVSQSQLDVEELTVQKNRLEAEQAEQEQQIATLEMNAKENELTATRAEVTRRRIVAPFDGVIVQVYVRKGEWVQPGQQALRIVNVDRLKAEGFVPAAQATADLAGNSVKLLVDSIDRRSEFAGTIVFVSPEVDPITSQVRVWAEIDNRDGRLRPGQQARMVIDSL